MSSTVEIPIDVLETALGFTVPAHKNMTDRATDREEAKRQIREMVQKRGTVVRLKAHVNGACLTDGCAIDPGKYHLFCEACCGIRLTPSELMWCRDNPDILRALADCHSAASTEAEAMEFPTKFHDDRMAQLRRAADQIEEDL